MAVSESNNGNETWTIPAHLRLELLAALSVKPNGRDGRVTMTWDEFLDWADEDTLAEWVNGEVVMTSPASARHQDVVGFLYSVLKTYVTFNQAGKVYCAPFQMKLAHSGREPDILVIATEHLARLKATYLDGPADLVVEVLSPESVGRDWGEKFFAYSEGGHPRILADRPRDGACRILPAQCEGQISDHLARSGRHLSLADAAGLLAARGAAVA